DTTAEALWRHLQAARYRESWKLWPGKSRLYKGTEPHGMLLTTYANDVAHRALLKGQVASLPAGSILVKENYMPDSTFAAATVMYRVRGYNPEHQDWLFAKYDAEGRVDDFGRAPMCQACHQAAKSGTYIYTPVGR
ncbi:MAG: cytochrome P460 family protein, partial [Gemmatimonadota bacterium]